MLVEVVIPARLAAQFASGAVTLMSGSLGATTSLINATTGKVVGTAWLVPAGSVGGGSTGLTGAGASAGSLGAFVVAGLAVIVAGVGAYLLYRRHLRRKEQRLVAKATNVLRPDFSQHRCNKRARAVPRLRRAVA